MSEEKNHVAQTAARNHAIDEYYKVALNSVLMGGGTRQPEIVVQQAMQLAIAAYEHRCQVLGTTFCRKYDKI